AKQLSLSLLYWLQTERGYRGLRLRPDLTGTADGVAKTPYIREARRIAALKTVREQDVATESHPGADRAPSFDDSVGIGAYRIDLHPSTS
ncbi:FAD-dependent oxidoreductase, partial [Acinetobacter baumannii]